MTIHRKHLGTRAELIACSWLLKEGYEVFRNVSPHGLIDVIAIKNGVILKLDVRSSGDDKNFARLTAIQTQEGIFRLKVFSNGDCEIDFNAPKVKEQHPCKSCNTNFLPKFPRHKFCSKRCLNAYRTKRLPKVIEIQCDYCGAKFLPKNRRRGRLFCSGSCAQMAHYHRTKHGGLTPKQRLTLKG